MITNIQFIIPILPLKVGTAKTIAGHTSENFQENTPVKITSIRWMGTRIRKPWENMGLS